MQREIKFRAWDKQEKTWYKEPELSRSDVFQVGIGYPGIVELMQYTGLKDKNGKEIYEGDVVKFSERYGVDLKWSHSLLVFWDYDRWAMKNDNAELYAAFLNNYTEARIKIIGNIYENPELISGTIKEY